MALDTGAKSTARARSNDQWPHAPVTPSRIPASASPALRGRGHGTVPVAGYGLASHGSAAPEGAALAEARGQATPRSATAAGGIGGHQARPPDFG
jgi:hypothetical protein